jgi:amino acid adenylation domain-containing protein
MSSTRAHHLLEVLERHAELRPHKAALRFLTGEGSVVHSYGSLLGRARAIGAVLQAHSEEEDRVLLLCPPGLPYVEAFLGCAAARRIAVPAYPPSDERMLRRLLAQIRDCGATAVVSTSELLVQIEPMASSLGLGGLTFLAADVIADDAAHDWKRPAITGEHTCFLQYTSGSTREPRGVVVSHSNLLANEAMIREAFDTSEDSVILSWLPLYHDMGLIGMLHALYLGASAVLMSPADFLRRPARWLSAISEHRATVSGGPNFAYELCLRRIGEPERQTFDLSCWRTAYNGAEPINAATLERFARAFEGAGFQEQAFLPCYGMAESTLLATGTAAPRPLRLREVGGRPSVGCGRPARGELLVVDPVSRRRLGPAQEGEIWIRGEHVARGYWGRPEESAAIFEARLADTDEGPFLRTGDLGLLDESELFVTGRIKDLVIVRGRNHYPQDLERTAEASHPSLRAGCGAAFSVIEEGRERLVIVQEADAAVDGDAACAAIRQAIALEHELHADVVLLRPRTIPKTSSGKIQRSACKAAFLEGSLSVLAQSERTDAPELEIDLDTVLGRVRASLARALGVSAAHVSPERPLGELGLDSLMSVELAHEVEERFGVVLPVSAFLGETTLLELARQIESRPERPVPQRSALCEGPLSRGQAALWLFQQLHPDSSAYHVASAVHVEGTLDRDALRRALRELGQRHPILRTVYALREGQPVQRVLAESGLELVEHDARGESDEAVRQRVEAAAARPFDLAAGPVFRTELFDRGHEQILLFTAHHVAVDMWSLVLLVADLRELYAGRPLVPSAGLEYLDFALHEASWLASPEGEESLRFWQDQLQHATLTLDLPTDRPRPPAASGQGAVLRFSLDRELLGSLHALARAERTTLHTVLLTAFQVLLARTARQDELVVGVVAANRARAAFDATAGYFVNTLPIRADLSGSPSFAAALAGTRQTLLGALDHPSLPFATLVERTPHARDTSRAPLVQALFVLDKPHRRDLQELSSFVLGEGGGVLPFGGVSLRPLALREQGAPFDLTLRAVEVEQGLVAALQYSTDLFEADRIAHMAGHFEALLRQIVRDRHQPIDQIELLAPEERQRVVVDFNATAVPYRGEACVHELFEQAARRHPDAVALVFGARSLTYRELDGQANRWALQLRELGVGPEVPVGLCVERSLEMVVAMLAIVKAGGFYVPIDADHPRERLAYLLRDIELPLILGQGPLLERLPLTGQRTLEVEALWGEPLETLQPPALTPGHLLYLMYTSGSTGRPNGVAVPHAGVVRLLDGARYVRFGPGEVFFQYVPQTFDVSTFEIWGPLLHGSTLLVPPPGQLSLHELAALVREGGVTTLWLTSGLFAQMAEEQPEALGAVRQLLAGGDVVSPAAARRVLQAGAGVLVNGYGPTEATTFATYARFEQAAAITGPLPIGRPLENTTAYIVDASFHPVPVGIVGELCIGGPAVARGYWRRPERTAERFVPDPFSSLPGARMYRTGDLARFRSDGTIDFLGRADHQLKIRGFRVEPGEVEVALLAHPGVRAVAVVPVTEPRDKYLAAYVVLEDPDVQSELRAFLEARLPAFLVPSVFVTIDKIPRTHNGKVDRKRLPRPQRQGRTEDYQAPRDPVEVVLAEIWAGVLGVARIGAHDNFFDIGGHSLLATSVLSRVSAALGVTLPMRALFERPTVAGLAESVREASAMPGRLPPIPASDRDADAPLSFTQARLWLIEQLDPESAAYNMPIAVRLDGELSVPALREALQGLVARHEALRTRLPSAGCGPVQQVVEGWEIPLEIVEVEPSSADALALEEARRPFSLAEGPLVRFRLLRLGARAHVLLLTMHHIVSDGWSLGLVVRDLAAGYRHALGGSPPPQAPRTTYRDYAIWQRERSHEAALAWWKERLAGAPTVLELPFCRSRPPKQRHQGAKHTFFLDGELAERATEQGRQEGATLFMVLLAAFEALLHRYTLKEDLLVGVPVAGRDHPDVEDTIGCFVNTLPHRADLSGDPTFLELLRRVRRDVLQDLGQATVPFERLVQAAAPVRQPGLPPLVQVMFALENAPLGALDLPGLEVSPLEIDNATAKFDLDLTFTEEQGRLKGVLEYSTDLFDADSMERLAGHYQRLLEGGLARPEMRVAALDLLPDAERQQILELWAGEAAPPAETDLLGLFSAQAARAPAAVAVSLGADRLTYAELERRSDRLARRLREAGVGPEQRVGICLPRSVDLVVAVLAVWKAGGAYVPLDEAYPTERLRYLLGDCGAKLVLSAPSLADRLEGFTGAILSLDEAPEEAAEETPLARSFDPDRLAYVIYTSGSTGKPKGAMVTHRNLATAHRAWQAAYTLPAGARHLQMASFSFDVFTGDLVRALCSGGELVLCPRETLLVPDELHALIVERRLEIGEFVPAVLRGLVSHLQATGQRLEMKAVVAGSDAWSNAEWDELRACCAPETRLVNTYGLTECTVDSTLFEGTRAELSPGRMVPIGRPFAGTRLYLLDRELAPVPAGAVGEVYIGGDTVARGYLGRPALTAERFLPDPHADRAGARMYRSGDLARWLPDGNLELLGRADDQVKVRGQRVELGEIEAALQSHPGVTGAVVVVQGDGQGGQRLVAHVVGRSTGSELREHLAARLPAFMVPSAYVSLERIPLTPNGKVDRRALPPAGGEALVPTGACTPLATPVERALGEIWARVLGVQQAYRDSHFFEDGGHSLLGIRLVSEIRALGVELSVRALFDHPTLAALAAQIEAGLDQDHQRRLPPLAPGARGEARPLSFSQERLWFLDQLEPHNPLYNMFGAFHLEGELSVPALARAFDGVCERHESLRTRILTEEGAPVQELLPPVARPLLPEPCDRSSLPAQIAAEAARPFELAAAEPLLRARLFQLSPREHVLLVSMHHIASDARSIQVLLREIEALYAGETPGPLPAQYADFARWQRQTLDAPALEAGLAWWKQTLSGPLPVLDLPFDRPRPRVQSHRGAAARFELPSALVEGVRRGCREQSVTPFMLSLAAFATLLHRYTGQTDLIVGSPISGRDLPELQDLIGFFVNTLALRLDLSGQPSGRELLRRVREASVGAYTHRAVPFERVVEALAVERDLGRAPLFSVMFALEDDERDNVRLPGLRVRPLQVDTGTAKFDLSVFLQQGPGSLSVVIEYNTDLYDRGTIERLASHYERLLAGLLADLEAPVSSLPLLPPCEQRQLDTFNQTERADVLAQGATVHALFEAQARRTPEAEAVRASGRSVTYAELDRWSNRLAHRLVARGVGPETAVGVYLERSIELVVALLGVLKAGGAYLPLDLSYPRERLAMMLEDAQAPLVIAGAEAPTELASSFMCLTIDACEGEPETSPAVDVRGEHLAYVMFTSGSTGRPKGVMYPHAGTVNRLQWQQRRFPLGPDDRLLQKTPFGFDVSVWEFFWPLMTGAVLVMARPEGHKDNGYLAKTIAEEAITTVHFVPSMLELFLEEPSLSRCTSLRRVIASGEALSASLQQRFFARLPCVLVNQYGPTESGEASEWEALRDDPRSMVPIGRPLHNFQLHVLDPDLAPMPIGVFGELYIGGMGLARGYYGRPELTAARFVPDPSSPLPGARLYRTGDLVRWLADGTLEFQRRIDAQIKLRGQRIELGEIEATLRTAPLVRQAAVLLRAGARGDARLVGYVVAEPETELAADELRAHLARTLPDYMIPSAFVVLPELPLTPTGKLDTLSLPDAEEGSQAAFVAPRTALEQVLAELWSEVLEVPAVGVRDNFFEIGGHSLLAMRLVSLVRDLLGVELPLRALFEAQSVEALAQALRAQRPDIEASARRLLEIAELPESAVEAMLREREAPRG